MNKLCPLCRLHKRTRLVTCFFVQFAQVGNGLATMYKVHNNAVANGCKSVQVAQSVFTICLHYVHIMFTFTRSPPHPRTPVRLRITRPIIFAFLEFQSSATKGRVSSFQKKVMTRRVASHHHSSPRRSIVSASVLHEKPFLYYILITFLQDSALSFFRFLGV